MASKLTIQQMCTIAKSKGGKCLSRKYVNNRTKLEWQCKENHKWMMAPDNVKQGQWCPECGHKRKGQFRKLNIQEMYKIAKERKGKCLSRTYINNSTKLKWQCKRGHVWYMAPRNLKIGHWCNKCAIKANANRMRDNIEHMQKIAKERGGKCLSKSYKDNVTKLTWQCKFGHVWEATPRNIKTGQWCKECSVGFSERLCRKIFESIFGLRFPKRRPKWLVNDDGNLMELDGYCSKLNIAFEYQGRQHYQDVTYYPKRFSLHKRAIHDRLKKKLCQAKNIKLIRIPYTIKTNDIHDYIVQQCRKQGIDIPYTISAKKRVISKTHVEKEIWELQEVAKERGGKCLSLYYKGNHEKLKWRCSKGHEWSAEPSSIKNMGTWCPVCSYVERGKRKRLTIEEMQEIAKKR